MKPNTIPDYPTYDETLASVRKELSSLLNNTPSILQSLHTQNDETLISYITDEEKREVRACTVPQSTSRPLKDVISDLKFINSSRGRLGHARFFSFVPNAPSPLSWLGEVLSQCYNTFSGGWIGAPGSATLEMSMCVWLAEQLGLPPSAGGVFVSGGSIANMTALTMARDQKLGSNLAARACGVVYLSDQTHFCILKSLRILGFVPNQVRVLPSDSACCFDVVKLEQAINIDLENGLTPFLVVATCGTTSSGSIDPLHALADLAQAYDLWLHVDGAYGASVALSKTRRHLIDGIGRAHSVAWDAHKWLFQTFGCGMILVRDKAYLRTSFAATADLVRDIADQDDEPNLWNYTMELTRPARHIRLWFTLQALGLDTISHMIDHGFELADLVHAELRKRPNWQIICPPGLAVINFRYYPDGRSEQEIGEINRMISRRLLAENIAVIMTNLLKSIVCLRICTINPIATSEDVRTVVDALDRVAQEICPTDLPVWG